MTTCTTAQAQYGGQPTCLPNTGADLMLPLVVSLLALSAGLAIIFIDRKGKR